MKQTVNFYQFVQAFREMDRNNFSHDGLRILYDYLEDDDFNEYDLDVIELCCNYTEATPMEIVDMYSIECDFSDLDEYSFIQYSNSVVIEYLNNQGVFIGKTSNDTIVFQNF